ncbi:fungal-specific transcription factor domain-containing protein [Aspergillus navahoensis]
MHFTDDASGKYARYHCSVCRRPFDRKDVLLRHMHVHNSPRAPPGARRKACLSCARSKTRCNGERPTCSSCKRRNLTCTFERPASGSYQQRRTQYNNSDESLGAASEQNSSVLPPALPEFSSLGGARSVATLTTSETESIELNMNQSNPNLDWPNSSLTAAADLVPKASAGFSSDLLFTAFDNPDFNTNADWILESSGSEEFPTGLDSLGTVTGDGDPLSQLLLMSAPQTTLPSAKNDAASCDPGDGAALGGLLIPQPRDTLDYGDPWPLETPRPPPRHISLPPLGSDQQESSSRGRYYTLMPINDRTWHALQKCIQLPFEHNTLQSLSLDNFPSKEKLNHCIDLYFAHFQPTLSFIHQPTFDPGKDLVVTLAMISIGACYTEFAGAKAFSITLSELIRRLLVFMAEHDHRFVRTQSYLAAELLQGIHGFCSGSERLFELSESYRSSLIHHTKCMGIFRIESEKPPPPGARLEDIWQSYIRAESSRRLGWAVFKYDASVAYLHNNRPFLSCADVNLNLPGSTEHWEAETAEVWASLHPWSRNVPPTSALRPTMDSMFSGSPNPVGADDEHLFIIVLTLLRMLWTAKEISSFPIGDLGIPSMCDEPRRKLLRAIDQMTVPIVAMSKSHTRPEMERLVHRMQLVHIAHIYGAGDLMNWLFPYLRDGLEAGTIKVRMRQWANEDPRRTREVAYHSAQIIGLVRHYPTLMPLQSFLIFHAGVVLSCMSFLLPESISFDGPSLQLDKVGADTVHLNPQMDWVNNGGNNNLRLVGVPSLCSPIGRQQVLNQTASLLKRQKTWGIAQNLTKVVLSLSTRDAGKRIQDVTGPSQPFPPASRPVRSPDRSVADLGIQYNDAAVQSAWDPMQR